MNEKENLENMKNETPEIYQEKLNSLDIEVKGWIKSKSYEISDLKFFGVWDYSKSPEDISFIKLQENYDLFIGGKFSKPHLGKYFPTINPANEEILSYIAYATEEDVNKAVESAKIAYEKYWSKLKPKERAKYIYKIAKIIQDRLKELAIIETLDSGKPIKETRDFDIPLSAQYFFYYAGWADKLEYVFPGRKISSIGIVGQIIPWNFPLLIAARKIASALAAGNTVVIKAAETTPLSLIFLAEIIQEANLPDGTVNILTGDNYTESLIIKHPDIKKVSFSGSREIGKNIPRSATNKRITLELEGKNPLIILDDAPIDQALEAVIKGIYFNQGQGYYTSSRLLLQESIKDEFLQKLKDRIKTIRMGDPLDNNTDMGAINSATQLEKIKRYIEIGQKEGCNLYIKEVKLPSKGYWFPPCFFTNVTQSCTIAQEEIFGPVLSIITFRDPYEAIKIANNTFYGLAAGIWTNNPARLMEIARHLRAGVIWANTYNQFDAASPLGGYKESGFGREGGLHGLLSYLEIY